MELIEIPSKENKVPKGYNKTEIGIFPSDWVLKPLNEFAKVSSGGTPNREIAEFWGGTIPWITTSQIDFNTITYAEEFITEKGLKNSAAKYYKSGTILMAMYGQGKTRGKSAILGIDATTNQACAAILLNKTMQINYIFYNLSNRYNEIRNLSNNGSQENLNGDLIKKILIPIPPTISEQTSIAAALSDADELIRSLEQLIAKKKLIKQGAMQELLRAKEGWVIKKMHEIAEVSRGRVISHKEIELSNNNSFPVYSSQTSNNGIMGFIDTYDYDGEYVTWTTDGVNAGTVFYRNGKFNCTNVCGTLKIKNENALFVSLILNTVTDRFVSKNLANPKLMNDIMKNIEIPLPPKKDQNAIAETLNQIEVEILNLEIKLIKLKQIKQGMMQDLLTGRVRLV